MGLFLKRSFVLVREISTGCLLQAAAKDSGRDPARQQAQ
jgi:hypothetical protein